MALCPAPFADDIDHGKNIVKDADLEISTETPTLRTCLGKITADNLDESFYPFTALRFLVGGFKMHKSRSFIESFRRKKEEAEREANRMRLDSVSRVAYDEFNQIKKAIAEENASWP